MKTIIKVYFAVVAVSLACLSPVPGLQAVVPPPDGGYPGATTAEGSNALQNLTTGLGNTATGWHSLFTNTTGNLNTATGAGTLFFNTGDNNTATGALALLYNTNGSANTADGVRALFNNTTGSENTATGALALLNNATGQHNTADGFAALGHNTTGSDNTAVGWQALVNNDSMFLLTGEKNTAVGSEALFVNISGSYNTAVGWEALFNNVGTINGNDNTAVGAKAIAFSAGGRENTALGSVALLNSGMLGSLTSANTAIGYAALYSDEGGSGNTAVGHFAGYNLTGSDNIDIGNQGVAGESNTIRIGTDGTHTNTYIAGIYGTTIVAGSPVLADSIGHLGTQKSSERFKRNIKAMDNVSEAILALKPVTFCYKQELDPNATPQFGLIAEEVAKANPALVLPDKEGKPYTVRYDAVNAMLLNEFLKEHRKNQQQESTIAELKAELTNLDATVREQAAKLQRVVSELESTKRGQEVAFNR